LLSLPNAAFIVVILNISFIAVILSAAKNPAFVFAFALPLPCSCPCFFSCHPSPQAEDLLLLLLFPFFQPTKTFVILAKVLTASS
jgi:hypothetical protein